jgi:hypothetical protein
MTRGVRETWRMFQSDSRFETVIAAVSVVVWLFLAYRKVGGGGRRTPR